MQPDGRLHLRSVSSILGCLRLAGLSDDRHRLAGAVDADVALALRRLLRGLRLLRRSVGGGGDGADARAVCHGDLLISRNGALSLYFRDRAGNAVVVTALSARPL